MIDCARGFKWILQKIANFFKEYFWTAASKTVTENSDDDKQVGHLVTSRHHDENSL